MNKMTKETILCGIDGCRNGWVVARSILSGNRFLHIEVQVVANISQITDFSPDVVAIDIPIGLPAVARKGGRLAEKEARKNLPGRASCVFSSPCRPVLTAANYQEALQLSRNSCQDGVGLSKQTWNIVAKIKEVDDFLQANLYWKSRFFEVHPELSFSTMKTDFVGPRFPSKHTAHGLDVRQKALFLNGIDLAAVGKCKTIHQGKKDDHLDALACLWSAKRIAAGVASRVPQNAPSDSTGLAMAIHW